MFAWFQKPKNEFSLLLLDIDHFKRINDAYGHDVGDNILVEFSDFCKRQLSAEQVFRIGGEEFVILLNGVGEESLIGAESLRAKVENQDFRSEDKRIYLTISAGLVQNLSGKNLSEVLKEADAAMYRAKKLGRNRLVSQGA